MNTMFDFLDRIQVQKEPRPEQYLGEDGLIYCGKCHTPVQCRITFEGKERIMPCICKCQKEERERQEQRMKEEEQLLYVRRLKAAGIQERHLQDWTFASATDTHSVQMAKRYVENWKKVKAENIGLLLWGDVGTGKSFLAACIANALLEKGVPVLMTNFSKILNQMGAMYSDERYRYIASFNRFSLLIIDDLGIERNTEYALEQVYAVVDERYKAAFFEWIHTLEDSVDRSSLIGEAVLYTLNQEVYLKRYLEDGHLSIDNLAAERALKNFAIGRRNWLFAKSIRGAQASATVYSVTETAMLNGLKPYNYLTYVMERMKEFGPFPEKEAMLELLPWSNSLPADCHSKLKK